MVGYSHDVPASIAPGAMSCQILFIVVANRDYSIFFKKSTDLELSLYLM